MCQHWVCKDNTTNTIAEIVQSLAIVLIIVGLGVSIFVARRYGYLRSAPRVPTNAAEDIIAQPSGVEQ